MTCAALQRLRSRRAADSVGADGGDVRAGQGCPGGDEGPRRVLNKVRQQPANAGPEPTLMELCDRADSAIDAARRSGYLRGKEPLLDFGDKWTPLRDRIKRLRTKPDTAANRDEARSIIASIPDISGQPGLTDDALYYAQHPKEGIKTTLGFTDPTGKDNDTLPSWLKWVGGAVAAALVAEALK